jgi:hypothetical protein
MPAGHYTLKAMPFATLTTKIYTAREGIGSGDEVFFVGLFTGHEGSERVEPIIRFGNISLMLPFEKIDVILNSKLTAIEAYLIEARSMGGFSGSPVFIYHPPLVRGQEDAKFAIAFRLPLILGLVFGQYESSHELSDGGEIVSNAGIAIVIPADKIRETIMKEKFKKERKEILERGKSKSAKGAIKPVAGDTNRETAFTANDMNDALKKASRKVSESVPETKETSE